MIEGDYVWLKPLQAPLAESKDPSWAFPFSYINPTYPGNTEVMRKMYPEDKGPLEDVPGSGPAPVLMRVAEWIKVLHRTAVHHPFLARLYDRNSNIQCFYPETWCRADNMEFIIFAELATLCSFAH